MQFTTTQLRTALKLPSQTLRYWRVVLPPLAEKPGGKSARFSIGEILALSVVAKLVIGLRIDVGAISPIASAIFELCKRPSLFGNSSWLHIDIEGAQAAVVSEWKLMPKTSCIILLPISEISKDIKEILTEPDEPSNSQLELAWPLVSIK